jgi:isoleucyl-tRNA synthetase
VVVLDVDVTADLEAEGLARDVVRLVQQARRDAGLDVTDRVRLEVAGPAEVVAAVNRHREWVAEQVLAVDLLLTDKETPDASGFFPGELPDGRVAWIRIDRADRPQDAAPG